MMAFNNNNCYYDPFDSLHTSAPYLRGRHPQRNRGYARDPNSYSDPYLQALVNEQLARRELAEAHQREQEARRRRELEEYQAELRARARAQAQAQARQQAAQQEARRRALAAQRARYSFPFATYDSAEEDEYPSLTNYLSGFAPRQRAQRQKSRSPASSPPVQSEQAPPATIPISSPSTSQQPTEEELHKRNAAASTIQSAYRSRLERKAAAVARTSALDKINAVASKLSNLRESFVTFPSNLDFDTSHIIKPKTTLTATEDGEVHLPYKLTYAPVNAPVHGFLDSLLKLLQELDTIESGGDAEVRHKRKEVVKEVEKEMAWIDDEVARIWKKSQEAPTTQAKEVDVDEMEVESTLLNSIGAPAVDEAVEEHSQPDVQAPYVEDSQSEFSNDDDDHDSTELNATTADEPIIIDVDVDGDAHSEETLSPYIVALPLPSASSHPAGDSTNESAESPSPTLGDSVDEDTPASIPALNSDSRPENNGSEAEFLQSLPSPWSLSSKPNDHLMDEKQSEDGHDSLLVSKPEQQQTDESKGNENDSDFEML